MEWKGLVRQLRRGRDPNWEDARRYGYVSAGGGTWYTATLKKLPIGGRVFVNLPGRGYVGVGVIAGKAMRASDFTVLVNGQSVPVIDAPHDAPSLSATAARDDEDTEWFVPVSWVKTVLREQAIKFKGRYGNQNSATKLTHNLTRETVLEKLGITAETLDASANPGDETAVGR